MGGSKSKDLQLFLASLMDKLEKVSSLLACFRRFTAYVGQDEDSTSRSSYERRCGLCHRRKFRDAGIYSRG